MCVYLFKSLTGRSRSPKAGSSSTKEGGRCALLAEESRFNSAGRSWGKQHKLQDSEATYKRENWNHSKRKMKKKKKRHEGIFKPLKAWEKALSKNHYSKVLMRLRLLEMRHLAYQGLWERRIEPEGKGFQMAGSISVARNAQILHAQVVRAAWSTWEKGMLMPTPN